MPIANIWTNNAEMYWFDFITLIAVKYDATCVYD